jgi:hypothetical protein
MSGREATMGCRIGWAVAVSGLWLGAAAACAADDLIPRRVLDPLDQCPCWTGRAESLLLWRDGADGVPLFQPFDGGAGATVAPIDAGGFASDMAAGPRFTLFRHTGDLGAIEFNYFNVQDFNASQAGTSPFPGSYLFADGVLCCAPFVLFEDVSATLSSEFQSFELNRRFPTDGRLQWLMGFRWVEWNDTLGIAGNSFLSPQPVTIDTAAANDLYGLQVGFDSFLWRSGRRFWIEGLGKAGLYYNDARQFTAVSSDLLTPAVAGGGTDTGRAAFVGELGVTGVWQITDRLALRTGWTAFWLAGLALAPNQLDRQCLICEDKPITQSTDTGGSVFVNGLTLGLEARW